MANKLAHPSPIVIELEGEVAAALRRAARRLDRPAVALGRDLVTVVLEDNLVEAVLDDQPAEPAAP